MLEPKFVVSASPYAHIATSGYGCVSMLVSSVAAPRAKRYILQNPADRWGSVIICKGLVGCTGVFATDHIYIYIYI